MMPAALAASVAVLLVAATGAQAKVVELTGTTTVTPSAEATQFLANNGVTVAPTGKATAEDGSFVFPIAAGFGNTRTYNGLLAHKGGLKFTKGERSAVRAPLRGCARRRSRRRAAGPDPRAARAAAATCAGASRASRSSTRA